jgi:hypothetical protein
MSESGKLTDRAAELASQAAAAAGPLKDKATELAGKAAAAAGPIAAQARDQATDLASKAATAAGPIAAQARDRAAELASQAAAAAGPLREKVGKGAAQGVETLADGLDRVTGGKYHDQITSVSTKIGERLDPDHGGGPASGSASVDSGPADPASPDPT